ncbi:hypothetical protein C8J56DRAFT_972177 [Mycena floridula]|nr:hypothetical protein C8J56DRAFT_972177 [Mycena floridula]
MPKSESSGSPVKKVVKRVKRQLARCMSKMGSPSRDVWAKPNSQLPSPLATIIREFNHSPPYSFTVVSVSTTKMTEAAPEEPLFSSPHVESEVPDPFLVDSDEEDEAEQSASQQTITPLSEHIPLSALISPQTSFASPNFNKDVPPPPESDIDEEDAPELYLPALVLPTMFLPIPNTDPLTTLLTKYIVSPENRPVRDLSGDWKSSDFHTLVMTNSWRALATMARDRIVTTDPEDLALVLGLWYLRLASLSRLRLFNQTSAECTNLFSVINSIEPTATRQWLFDRLLPFELEVMQVRLKFWAGDHMGYIDALYGLLKKCKDKARQVKSDPTTVAMWKERGSRICLILASQMVEMKDYLAAAKILEPLCEQDGVTSPLLRSAVARIYLQGGYLKKASNHFAAVAADPTTDPATNAMNEALMASAAGDWERTTKILEGVLAKDSHSFVSANNLSVALLCQGKVKEGIEVLEKALHSSPSSVVVAEPFLFNLSTLYELRSATAVQKKRELLAEVAKWSGDGLKTACLKMSG